MKSNKQSIFIVISIAFVIMIATLMTNANTVKFSDIQGHWAKNTIEWAVENGLAKGYEDGTFKPDKMVTEAEFITLLIRAFRPEIEVNRNGHWAENYYKVAQELNYPVKGIENPEMRDKAITRTQVAEILSSAEGVNYSGDDAIKYLLAFNLANGNDPNKKTVESYMGHQQLTRAQSVQFIYNFKTYGIFEELRPRPTEPSDPSLIPDWE